MTHPCKCGSTPVFHRETWAGMIVWGVRCSCGYGVGARFNNADDALQTWNDDCSVFQKDYHWQGEIRFTERGHR